jgi:hypothetical protein
MVLEAIISAFNTALEGIKWFVNTVARVFPFSNESKIFVLAIVVLLMSLGLIVWFGGAEHKSVSVGRPAEDAEGTIATITLSTSSSSVTSTTRDPCLLDYTCLSDPDACSSIYLSCCPAGSLGEYRCVEDVDVCDDDIGWESLGDLQNVSFHCGCTENADCANDTGGHTCCAFGTNHYNYCYYEPNCDSI